jgi:hypothetical protein
LLVDGRIEAAGPPDTLVTSGNPAVRAFIEASGIEPSRLSRPPP